MDKYEDLTGGRYCPNILCNRSDVERYYDEHECMLPNCPYDEKNYERELRRRAHNLENFDLERHLHGDG